MTKASSKKEHREASTHSRGARTSLTLKSKINVKENERIARMKAAREAYSKLSQARSAKQKIDSHVLHCKNDEKRRNKPHSSSSNTSNAAAASFKPMASSLEMIHSGGIRTNMGRASSIAGARSIVPRPSLLPLGINIFGPNVSAIDKMKVRDFIESRLNSGTTPKKAAPLPSGAGSELSSRTQFRVGATIEEQRESFGDGVFADEHVIHAERHMAPLCGSIAPHSILKKKKVP
ncbi:hypothetical protein GCK32_011522 [Trichostrongylus colubriformis]|uniref:Uncharacterized protein n=1 Tax=Trichostrongylus colubriformis TaxID=6319 RepID=A0AAN8F7L8_TRICO